ncbi:MAG: hypothetical protein AAGA56_13545, partial [Myxococcota bacterium]
MTWRNWIAATGLVLVAPIMGFATGCGSESADTAPIPPATTPADDDDTPDEGICLLNNCSAPEHCVGCLDGRDICLVEESRCVACNPTTGEGCAEGEECSSFGICVPIGLTCPTDNQGNPQITCTANADCKACSPQHQVCDTETGKCQACIATNTQHCLASDICADLDMDGRVESCSAKCPAACDEDNDCSQCINGGVSSTACFDGFCAQCSDTFPCPADQECQNGTCVAVCGIPGGVAGNCTEDEDCQFCGDPNDASDVWFCRTPTN